MPRFSEVAGGVYVLRHPVLDVNSTLIVGDGEALLVDTLSTAGQGAELAAAVRRVTAVPYRAVNTHHHFDHCFGNASVEATEVWGHVACAERLAAVHLPTLALEFPELAAGILAADVRPPDRTLREEAVLDIGGRTVQLVHLGRGHTDDDVVVVVPDAAAVVAGDLVESAGPPSFEDGWTLDWPATTAALLEVIEGLVGSPTVVPGHGLVVGAEFVAEQHAELARLAWLSREGHADDRPAAEVAAVAPFGPDVALVAVRRAYADLDGRL
ncbi:MAG TPA: MBL fold metallo-hydrolase [Mycobacteriales bacterium]|nr:MBL fold metallo-hydrolase [Mycobacteriales bacterium]